MTLTYQSQKSGVTRRNRLLPVLAFTLVATLLASCAAPPPRPLPPATVPPAPADRPAEVPITEEERLEQMLALADAQPSLESIRAAALALRDQDAPKPEQIARIHRLWNSLTAAMSLAPEDRLLGAQMALLANDPAMALARLQPLDPEASEPDAVANFQLGADLLRNRGEWLTSLRLHVALDSRLRADATARKANQNQIWQLLAMLDNTQLHRLAGHSELPADAAPTNTPVTHVMVPQSTLDHSLAGWARLFLEMRTASHDSDAVTRNFSRWEILFPNHPGTLWMEELETALRSPPEESLKVAALLPLSGPFGDLGEAILDGILTQFYASLADTASELMVFDTVGDPQIAADVHAQALAAGANRVIGPLTRLEVDRIASSESAIPTLFLNRPSMPVTMPFSALALAPEEDARVAATRALDAGDRNAIMLLPPGDFGDRVGGSFRQHFESGGGRILAEYRIDPGGEDVNERVGAALGIEDSRQRIRRTQRILRLPLEADPQVRPELETILLAGAARDLRMLVPHVHYHRASHLRMLATSHAYEGFPQPVRDGDLGGVEFPDAPLVHRNELVGLAHALDVPAPPEHTESRWLRFTALGIDAMQASVRFSQMQIASHLRLPGAAGTWTLQPHTGVWVREPIWMEFRDGLPRPVNSQSASTAAIQR